MAKLNAVATISRDIAPPKLSQSLGRLCHVVANGTELVTVPHWVRDEARGVLAALEAITRPVGRDVALQWLLPLAAGCTIALTETQFNDRCKAILPVIEDMPIGCFTVASSREALLTFAYFPGAKDLVDFLSTKCREWLIDRAALRKIVAHAEPPPAPLDDQQRAAIERGFADLKAQLRAEAVQRAQDADNGASSLPDVSLKGEALAALRRQVPPRLASVAIAPGKPVGSTMRHISDVMP